MTPASPPLAKEPLVMLAAAKAKKAAASKGGDLVR